MVENTAEQTVILRVKALRDAGRTFQAIADELNIEGVPYRTAKRWYPASVRSVALS